MQSVGYLEKGIEIFTFTGTFCANVNGILLLMIYRYNQKH